MIRYRPATRAELDTAIEWAAAEGWNPGLHDADAYWATDPEGFVCAEDTGEVVATGSIVSYGGAFGFMGFFIVRPDRRGQGIGRTFWRWRRDALLARLRPDAAIGMDGVFDMQAFYAKGGFVFSHRNLRMAGTGRAAPRGALEGLADLSTLPCTAVAACDLAHFGCARQAFLQRWITPAGGRALGAWDGQQLQGYGVIRPCRDGFKIGPLFADAPELADRLFDALADLAAGQPVLLDTPENNPAALALAARHGLAESFGCARMYYGPAPALPWSRIFGVTSFELG